MKKLEEYDVLNKDVFYRTTHILEYIKNHPEMSELDKMAIKATIMEALVYKGVIDKEKEFLDLDNLSIDNNSSNYHYEKTPDISGIPLEIKDELRKHCIYITGGIPITMSLAKPSSKISRYCVYDPNTAVSSIFDDFTFYDVIYKSPTRGVRIEEPRPFVEVPINGELYLVDILTKRIIKSTFFRDNYGFEIINQVSKSNFNETQRKMYETHISPSNSLASYIFTCYGLIMNNPNINMQEMKYELEKSKEDYPDAWNEAAYERKMMELLMGNKH